MPNSTTQHIFGWHAVLSALEQTPGRVRRIWIDEGRTGERPQTLIRAAEAVQVVTLRTTRAALDAFREQY